LVDGEGTGETTTATVAAGASEQRFDRPEIEKTPLFRPLQVAVHLLGPSADREVQERPRNRGHRNAVSDPAVLLGEDRRVTRKLRFARRRVSAVTCITSGRQRSSPQR
jgi:hypothetical protein